MNTLIGMELISWKKSWANLCSYGCLCYRNCWWCVSILFQFARDSNQWYRRNFDSTWSRLLLGLYITWTIDLPNSVIRIYTEAFRQSGFFQIRIPPRVTEIESKVFAGCLFLAHVELHNNPHETPPSGTTIRRIGDYAFEDCGAASKDFGNAINL